MKENILHIIDQSSYAGVTSYTVRIVKNLPDYNHRIVACYKGSAIDEILAMGITCEHLVNSNQVSYRSLLQKYIKSILFLSKNRFEIIHYHQGGIGVLLIAVIFKKNAKVIHHLHSGNLIGDNTKQEISFIHKILLKLLSVRTYQISVAGHVKKEYESNINKTIKHQTILNSVPFIFNRKDMLQYVIGYLGRFTVEKGFSHLESISKKIEYQNPQVKIIAMGETTNLLNEYLELFKEINFLTPTFDVVDFYNNIDLFIFFSTAPESLPLVILEAIAFDVGVVTYPLKGVVEILGEDYPLYINNPEDAISKIEYFYTDDFDRDHLSNIHRERSNLFLFSDMIRKINSLYNTLLTKN